MWLFSRIFEVQALRAKVQALSGEVQSLRSLLIDSEARYQRVYADLVGSYKAETNWMSSVISNRPVHADVPLAPAGELPNRFRSADGKPLPVNSRGGNARRAGRAATEEFLDNLYREENERLSRPETQAEMAASVPEDMLDETDPAARLIEQMNRVPNGR